jgi:hypothetical protein
MNGIFGVLLGYHMIENVSLRGKERLEGEGGERVRESETKISRQLQLLVCRVAFP